MFKQAKQALLMGSIGLFHLPKTLEYLLPETPSHSRLAGLALPVTCSTGCLAEGAAEGITSCYAQLYFLLLPSLLWHTMVLGFRLPGSCPGVICPTIGLIHPKLPSSIHCHSWSRFNKCDSTQVISTRIRDAGIRCFISRKCALAAGRNHDLAKADEDFDQEPFWIFMLKEALGFLKSLFIFLVEQPSQLKYIEWPSFQSTLKTATLTLLLVGLLIIALSSVDSALCYILSVLSRRRV